MQRQYLDCIPYLVVQQPQALKGLRRQRLSGLPGRNIAEPDTAHLASSVPAYDNASIFFLSKMGSLSQTIVGNTVQLNELSMTTRAVVIPWRLEAWSWDGGTEGFSQNKKIFCCEILLPRKKHKIIVVEMNKNDVTPEMQAFLQARFPVALHNRALRRRRQFPGVPSAARRWNSRRRCSMSS